MVAVSLDTDTETLTRNTVKEGVDCLASHQGVPIRYGIDDLE